MSRLERLKLEILTRSCPPELVDRVVGEVGRLEGRRRVLSARFTVYFVLALCLFPQVDYLEVLRLLKAGEPGLREWSGASKSSLIRARQRLGWQVMRDLHRSAVRSPGRAGDLFRGLRVLTLEGILLAAPGSAANREAFGKSGSRRSSMSCPAVRVVVAAECASRTVLDAAVGSWKDSERILSEELDRHIGEGALLLADRGFWNLARWHRLCDRGAHLLWRTEQRRALNIQDVLPDGSYLTRIEANKHSKAVETVKVPSVLVRVIEYRTGGQAEVVRLVTSLLDHEKYPADELAALYAQRWRAERVFDAVEVHPQDRPVLRSQTPNGVRQEIFAHLLVHYAAQDLLAPPRSEPCRAEIVRPGPACCPPPGAPSGFSL